MTGAGTGAGAGTGTGAGTAAAFFGYIFRLVGGSVGDGDKVSGFFFDFGFDGAPFWGGPIRIFVDISGSADFFLALINVMID